ncbi:MAG: hypothetical protein HUN04_11810 [Desulfobacter sp.]|nr:MAG: hypothetical protein HUN04_11810 [Desulfobacter sp.]
MMPLTDRNRTLSPVLVFLLVIIPLFIGLYYWTVPSKPGVLIRMNNGQAVVHFVSTSKTIDDTVFLARDQALVMNGCKLIFRGIRDGEIRIDLIQLELDPESVYPQYLSIKKAESGFRLADSRFSLLSGNKSRLKLKIQPD